MALDLQTALSEYGAIGTFAQSNPELNGILQQAIIGEWDAARFERALWGTNWYQSLSDKQRQLEVLQATDPETYKRNIDAGAQGIIVQAAQMGKQISGQDANFLAWAQMWNGWDTPTLTSYIAEKYGNATPNGAYTGQAGDVQNHVRGQLESFGIPVNDAYVAQQVNDIVAGKQTTGGFDNQVIAQAAKLFPQYAQDFYEGRSLSDIAKPFIQQMGNTLEVDPSAIKMTDPTIQRALQGDGQNPTPLWQFNQIVKQDPRWQKTDNAKNAAYDTLAQIGKDWGFTG